MTCPYMYNSDKDIPSCPFMEDTCPFAWWCTHDHRWKIYNGSDHCGLKSKMYQEGWLGLKSVGNGTMTIANGCREDSLVEKTDYKFEDGKTPICIKCPKKDYSVLDVIYI